MAKFLIKHLGKLALMTAAALWASCSDVKEEKSDKTVVEKPQTAQTDEFHSAVEEVLKNANSKYRPYHRPYRQMDTTGAIIRCEGIKCDESIINMLKDDVNKVNGKVAISAESDIEVSGEISNTKPLVLKTIRNRIPGLRHISHKYLKKKPEFDGMVVLNLKIAAGGVVENVDVMSSTTGYQEFDAEIAKQTSRWHFPKSKAGGNVTIPFTFHESH